MSGVCRECERRKPEVFSAQHYGGGSYNRAGRWYDSTICLDCATRLYGRATPGHSRISGWGVSTLRRIAGVK